MRHVTELSYWEVTLAGGKLVEVWADGYQELDGAYVFGVLVDAEPEEIEQLLVTGRTPSNPVRVIIALARFPIDIVEDIHGGGSGPATPLIKVEQSPHRKAKQRRHSAER